MTADEPPREGAPGRRTDLGVEVTRDLGGSGRLARGGSTRYSTLKFSSRGVPREEEVPPGEDAPDGAERAPMGAPVTPTVAETVPVAARDEPPPGLLGRVARLLGLRG